MTTTKKQEPRRVWPEAAAAAARASIAMYKRDGLEPPQWVLDVAAGKPLPKDRPPLDPVTGERMAS